MQHRRPPFTRTSIALISISISTALHAQTPPAPTASDWGGIGLLQTPTARMADEGELSFTASYTTPNSRYNVVLQPLPWLEGAFRYVSVSNRRYGPEWLSGNQSNKDKSIDLKLRLLRESRWVPEVAAGFRDIGGTGLFSSEYVVASKRIGDFDASLGLATGYIGNRGDFRNPLAAIDDRFEERRSGVQAGKLNSKSVFQGPVGVFGGIAYQTPWDPLQIKVEYDGNDYKHEPQQNNFRQRSPINIGASYALNKNVQLHLGWERGDTAMFGITVHANLANATAMPKLLDPLPIDGGTGARATAGTPPDVGIDWNRITEQLSDNAGLRVGEISRRGSELIISGEQRKFFYPAQGLGRASRIVAQSLPSDINWITIQNTRLGLPIVETSMELSAFHDYLDHRIELNQLAGHIEQAPPAQQRRTNVYTTPIHRFDGGFNIGYQQSLGGPDGFILFQIAGTYSSTFYFTRNTWLSGTASYNAYNNYNKFRYDAPSNLPRVRTNVRQYLTTADLTLPNLQITSTRQLGSDLYGMAYAGLFESMYGGLGAEVIYRPLGERWAIGAEMNWVKQRDFDQRLSFRDYSVATGHATFYYQLGNERKIIFSTSAGRYLAKDWGATVSLSRAFSNGVSMGAYATKTNVSSQDFGEGSFDKGIYVSVPFDFMLPRSTRARANFLWNPLYRDGGARLSRSYSLYQATSERDPGFFFDNLNAIEK
ncbi:YjbH domain-containing protein [Stenotrophomonas sp. GD03993]|uniref:YjbH domain-containing protein n=2 Tax=Stenotrophomonas TaxID=40323 RepID=UPI00131270BE|nr:MULTISPECIES: YjbH domain-containing protein [Stenotrophomonas]MBH1461106.1 YjbH domain-containing protein [Stenotrophomonas maltophilia]MDH0464518.1 YjbH domain-containing protein [Stenotrophomonas sp. GD03993]MDH0877024.1 YjbH domain-containing protein [Stenotrophomonas sp. GD03877]MDH2156544.1 YjbH domain-containing protein [Stenotrophomonas sp. GD03657]